MGINPILSDFKGPGTSKLDWRYLEHNKIDRNELQIRTNSQKGTGTKMAEKLNNFEKFERKKNQISALFLTQRPPGNLVFGKKSPKLHLKSLCFSLSFELNVKNLYWIINKKLSSIEKKKNSWPMGPAKAWICKQLKATARVEGHLNPGLLTPSFNHELFNPGLFNHEFLNNGVKKFMVEKSRVEKSEV